MINWFPVTRALMEDTPEFTTLPPAHKLYYLLLVSEFNERGPFYRADLEYAVRLGVSVETVRRARKNILAAVPGCQITPGWKSGRSRIATRYEHIAMPGLPDVRNVSERDEDEWFVKLHRYTFEDLLARTQAWWLNTPGDRLALEDIVVYVALWYSWARFTRHGGGRAHKNGPLFFITKSDLARLSGVSEVTECVIRLHQRLAFSGGAHLFDYVDKHQRFEFTNWVWFVDPSEDKKNAEIAEEYRQALAEAVRRWRTSTRYTGRVLSPEKCKEAAQEIIEDFRRWYREQYGTSPADTSYAGVEDRLARAVATYGKAPVARALFWYCNANDWPNPRRAATRTFSNFLASVAENEDRMKHFAKGGA